MGVCRAKRPPSAYVPPEGLVYGAAFIDRFLPVPVHGELRSDVWGATNVIPRAVENGIEDAEYSYWGGNIIVGDDGKNHLFVCRWPEDNVKGGGKASGHHTWWSSVVVHAVSDNPLGPYKVIDEVGPGHNPEIYRLADGSYKIGVMRKSYHGPTLNGPWTLLDTTLHIKKPGSYINESNKTFVPREDGSVLMMNKNGVVFISEKGDENFVQVTGGVYPKLPGEYLLEDPVIWKDEVQYNLIVNDCWGRAAFYMRSKDGLKWKWAPGLAYTPDIMKHEGGTSEKWWKFERPKVRQDQYGRATHMNFAVIDVYKDDDLANDNHSSKNIVIPLEVPRRLQILNTAPITAATAEIKVKILAEEGFDPRRDVDRTSLSFGAPEAVNFGKGCAPISTEVSGADLLVTFAGRGNGISPDHYAAKLIGRKTDGSLLFGFATLPTAVVADE
ncbi:glycoside hydrolase family protein [Pontiella sp. NLcol2]|uniref:Glycoside hydrolase family protein n=2 Tax=Pontiella agarivorans TaxID=3038953 RepID=A0ABU5N0S7_9BACT|nr:glycoside hydrolase family protein [Pontiella agarivorans]